MNRLSSQGWGEKRAGVKERSCPILHPIPLSTTSLLASFFSALLTGASLHAISLESFNACYLPEKFFPSFFLAEHATRGVSYKVRFGAARGLGLTALWISFTGHASLQIVAFHCFPVSCTSTGSLFLLFLSFSQPILLCLLRGARRLISLNGGKTVNSKRTASHGGVWRGDEEGALANETSLFQNTHNSEPLN